MNYERIPYLVVFKEENPIKDTYAGPLSTIALEAHLLKPEKASDTVIVFMHPAVSGGAYLPLVSALTKLGCHVINCSSRYRGNDSALIMEKVVSDLGACIRDAKERLGYKKVVLGGWSGGGSLSLFYQQQAEQPTITHTPAGDPYDLVAKKLIPADGLMLLAAHAARNVTLTEWLDPSIVDELNPDVRDPTFDLYAANPPAKAPFSADFVTRFRTAQIERNRRITRWVQARLSSFKAAGRPYEEFGFVVHGTMCDVRWLDPAQEPNDRQPNWCFMGDPRLVNNSAAGLARFSTLRSWLSQWSYDLSRANGITCAKDITVPCLQIINSADDGSPVSHGDRLYNALEKAASKERHVIQGANHYYFNQAEHATQAAAICQRWLVAQQLT